MSNGAVMSPQSNHADNNNDAKKVRKLELLDRLRMLCLFSPSIDKTEAEFTWMGDGGWGGGSVIEIGKKNEAGRG